MYLSKLRVFFAVNPLLVLSKSFDDFLDQVDVGAFNVDGPPLLLEQAVEFGRENVPVEVEVC